MTSARFRVYLQLEELDLPPNDARRVEKRFECATFGSRSEAKNFIHELLNHCACATGESELKDEMVTPELFFAGD